MFFAFYVSLLTLHVNAQQPTQEWVRRFSGPGNTGCGSIAMGLDPQGNVYVGGRVEDPFPNINYSLVKYSPAGAEEWVAYYNSHDSAADYLVDVAVDTSGNVYVTGYSGYNFGPFEILTLKYNTSGIFQWAKTFGSGQPRSITVDSQQNVIVTGGRTIKYSPNGDTLWTRIFSEPPRSASGLIVRSDILNNVYVGGTSTVPGSQNDFHVVKYSPNGTQLWWAFYNGPMFNSIDIAEDIAIDQSGNVILTGQSRNGSVTDYDYATVKYDSSGNLQWVRRYDGPISSDDYARGVVTDGSGNIYVTGSSNGVNVNRDFFTIKYAPNGDTLWTRRYDTNNGSYDEAFAITIDTLSSNIYVIGNGFYGVTTVKYSPTGTMQWVGTYPGTVWNVNKNVIKVNAQSNVYVLGRNPEISQIDCITIKYSDPLAITTQQGTIPGYFKLYQNYPNPFNSQTVFRFDIRDEDNYKLYITDILGREVELLHNGIIKSGSYSINYDAAKLSTGLYFYSIESNKLKETKKFILVK